MIEMNRNSQLHNKSNQQNRPLIFLFATTPKKPKKDLGLPFFLLFAPTLIPEAFQIKTVCSKKNHYQSLKKRKS